VKVNALGIRKYCLGCSALALKHTMVMKLGWIIAQVDVHVGGML